VIAILINAFYIQNVMRMNCLLFLNDSFLIFLEERRMHDLKDSQKQLGVVYSLQVGGIAYI
jgi:hypothetical protein